MALTFLSSSTTLTSWGFSAGDIAAMAGAGRAVGNWLMAQRRDRALLEFLSVTPEDILQRKGLLDVAALHSRWDQKLVLLKNGKRHTIVHPSTGVVVENMDSFTWFMSFVVATLDAAVGSKMQRSLISAFLMELLADKTTGGTDYLLNEIQQHIQGWRSISCVRSISNVARTIWQRLAYEGKHLPGNIPENDSVEVLRLLVWIASGKDFQFSTASTDVLCLAQVLSELGIELLVIDEQGRTHDENRLVVSLSTSPIPQRSRSYQAEETKRRGMRIPLDDMKECVSLWPGDATKRNRCRVIFENGMRAAEGVRLTVGYEHYALDEENLDVYYVIEESADQPMKRFETKSFRYVDILLLAPTLRAAQGVDNLVQTWPQISRDTLGFWLEEIPLRSNDKDEISHFDVRTKDCLSQLQIFLMGYYYAVLKHLLDSTQLPVQEAYGSWGWGDIQVIKAVRRFTLGEDVEHPGRYPRYEIMRLLGYFFTGAEYDDQLLPLRERSIGVLGKLALVTASLLGGADTPERVEKFVLLDVDPTCIPSNSRGIVLCGLRKLCTKITPRSQAKPLDLTTTDNDTVDFTSHIEPDWDYDVQRVLVAYRDHGRIVHRISPVDGDIAVLVSWVKPVENHILEDPKRAIHVGLDEFHGGRMVWQGDLTHVQIARGLDHPDSVESQPLTLVVKTSGLAKARTCLVAMYGAGVTALCSNSLARAAQEDSGVAVIT